MSPDSTRNPNLDLLAPVAGAGRRTAAAHSGATGATGEPAETWRENLGREVVRFPRESDWWTGRDPSDPTCPGRRASGTLGALPIPDLSDCTRADVAAYFENGWAITETLFAGLVSEESFYRPPYHGLRHPLVFYYVHPAALYANKLRVAGLLAEPIDALFEQLFETGVDEMSWDDLSKNEMDWPALSVCRAYRRRVFEMVSRLIATHPGLASGHPPVSMDAPLWALFLGFEHERIHIETSSVLIRELPLALVRRPAWFPAPHVSARVIEPGSVPAFVPPAEGRTHPANPFVAVAQGAVVVGKPTSFPSFGWDNEYGRRDADVSPFAASRHLVTNGEFHAFVREGGYRDDRWWSDAGRRWRTFRNVKWPTFWVPSGPQGSHEYALRTIFDVVEMPWDWPADVNRHEAIAFCAWRTAKESRAVPLRLLSENEHARLRVVSGIAPADGPTPEAAWSFVRASNANLGLRHGSETPVTLGAEAGGIPAAPFTDVLGNVWQWIEDDFHPLPGFRIHPVYDDFSTPCFDGQHSMILGGSFVSAGDEATLHARFHFRPHFFQHAGFRICDPLDRANDGGAARLAPATADSALRGGDRESRLYAAFAPAGSLVPSQLAARPHRDEIAARIVRWTSELGLPSNRALDVGGGVGGLAYALAATFREVQVADNDAAAIEDGRRALGSPSLSISPVAGAVGIQVVLDADAASRVSFRRTDASSLPADWVGFDAVVVSNLLTRLPSPGSLLGRMHGARGLVRPGGLLVVADTWDWNESVTPRELWFAFDPPRIADLAGGFDVLETFDATAIERVSPTRVVCDLVRGVVLRRRP